MATFLELQTELLSKANRSTTEADAVAEAKLCINDAIRWANRSNPFKYAERSASFSIDGNSFVYSLSSLCDGTIIGINTIQRVNTVEDFWGYPIELLSIEQLNRRRYRAFQKEPSVGRDASLGDRVSQETAFDCTLKNTDGFCAFLLGQSIGFYPKPASTTYFFITYNSQLVELSADADTNFFTEIGRDFILTKALQSFYYFLKEPAKADALKAKIATDWESLLQWDQRITYSHALSD